MNKVYIAAFGLAALGTLLPEPASAGFWPCREFLFPGTCHSAANRPPKSTKPWTTGVGFSKSANGANRITGRGGPADGEYAANIPGTKNGGKSTGGALDTTAGPSASGPARFIPVLPGSRGFNTKNKVN
jgi:hypothetical protein